MNTIVYHGSNESREMIREHEFRFSDGSNKETAPLYKFQVLITSYEVIRQDLSIFKKARRHPEPTPAHPTPHTHASEATPRHGHLTHDTDT